VSDHVALAREVCPKEGFWRYSSAAPEDVAYFRIGEVMPRPDDTDEEDIGSWVWITVPDPA
jgi:hypothetical protein